MLTVLTSSGAYMGTECSTFTRSTLNCTAGRGRTGWNNGTETGPGAAWEIQDMKKKKIPHKLLMKTVNANVVA